MSTHYEWSFNERGYVFSTDLDIEYEVKVVEVGQSYFSNFNELNGTTYEIGFYSTLPNAEKYDERISLTIVDIVKSFLTKGKVIIFVCDSLDNKQKSRDLLFKRWFRKHGNSFDKKDIELSFNDTTYYFSLLFDPLKFDSALIEKALAETMGEYVAYKA